LKGKHKRGIGLRYALQGIVIVVKEEKNFRIHICMATLAILFSAILNVSTSEWLFILFVIHLVFITELINSAIERLIDYIKPEFHPLAGAIKDIAASSVLVASILSIFVGCIIFIPKIINALSLF